MAQNAAIIMEDAMLSTMSFGPMPRIFSFLPFSIGNLWNIHAVLVVYIYIYILSLLLPIYH